MVSVAQANKALTDVATLIQSLVVQKAPIAKKPHKWKGRVVQPGNLKEMLRKGNTPELLLGSKKIPGQLVKTGKFNLKFSINVAPPGAEYGEFWNYPPTGNRKLKTRPEYNFASKAIKDAAVRRKIKELGPILASLVAQEIMQELKNL